MSSVVLKRLLDVIFTVTGLVILLPIVGATAVLVRFHLGKPVLFGQTRTGLGGEPFVLHKFRTMTETRNEAGELLSNKERLTPVGRFLRRTSLDELPGLFNVLKGELSLVGPRPLIPRYLPFYTEREKLRHTVRPGITGWAQIHGRNFLPWDERLALDVWYVENWTLVLDLKILAVTIWKVIKQESVSEDTQVVETFLDEERRER